MIDEANTKPKMNMLKKGSIGAEENPALPRNHNTGSIAKREKCVRQANPRTDCDSLG
jgi:hypothetical protein